MMSAYRTYDTAEGRQTSRAPSDRRSPSIASTQKFEEGADVSPVKNKYKFTRASDEHQQRAMQYEADKVVSSAQERRAPQSSKHPSLEDVQAKLRLMDLEHRHEARRRLQASEHRQQRAEYLRHVRDSEQAAAAKTRPSHDYEDYVNTMHKVERRALPVDMSVFTDRPDRASRSASPQAYERSASASLLPVGKRIDPSDVYYKPVQGKLQSMISNRNNAQDVDSYSRFHPTAATAAAGGRHDGIVPTNTSTRVHRSASATTTRQVNLSAIDEYTREVEAAQLRRLKGQAAILEAHQRGDHRSLHYDPLMAVRPVEWRQRDTAVLHGATPRSTLLKMQSTEQLFKDRAARVKLVGARAQHLKPQVTISRVPKGPSPKTRGDPRLSREPAALASPMQSGMQSGAFHMLNNFGVNTVGVFTAHPTGFEELPTRHKNPSLAQSPNTSVASASPTRSSASPRFHVPGATTDLLVNQPDHHYIVEQSASGATLREATGPLKAHENSELPQHSRRSADGQIQQPPTGHDPLVQQLLLQQRQQQSQIERLLKAQEAFVRQQPEDGAVQFRPVTATVAANNYDYYRRTQPATHISKYVSPSRSLTLNDLDVSEEHKHASNLTFNRDSHSPDVVAPSHRERTISPPNGAHIAAAFAFASSHTALSPGTAKAMDALTDALSPLSEDASPMEARPLAPQHPTEVYVQDPPKATSIGAIAQLFRSGGAATIIVDKPSELPPVVASGTGQSNVVRSDLFKPSGQRPGSMAAFREAFDRGEPLPHELAPPVAPQQQVEYYTDTSPPRPQDPAAMFLLQMAGRRALE